MLVQPIIWMMLEAYSRDFAHHMDDARGTPLLLNPCSG